MIDKAVELVLACPALNGNGEIDPGDSVYDHLLLWIDKNHNGISDAWQPYNLRDVGVSRISSWPIFGGLYRR